MTHTKDCFNELLMQTKIKCLTQETKISLWNQLLNQSSLRYIKIMTDIIDNITVIIIYYIR